MTLTFNLPDRIYDTSSNDTLSTEPLRRKSFLSNCEATDTGEGYQSEADCCFYEGARGGDERVKQ